MNVKKQLKSTSISGIVKVIKRRPFSHIALSSVGPNIPNFTWKKQILSIKLQYFIKNERILMIIRIFQGDIGHPSTKLDL